MQDVGTNFLATLQGARANGLIVRKMVYITAKDRETGEAKTFGLWSGYDPITTNVIDGKSGNTVERSYVGGVDLVVPSIPRTTDLTVQQIEISMSQIADAVQSMVRGYDPRLAPIEIHECLLARSGIPVAAPEPLFVGIVDEVDLTTPRVGDRGRVSLTVLDANMLMLTRKNFRKRSYEGQKQRRGDEFGKYRGYTARSKLYWGVEAK